MDSINGRVSFTETLSSITASPAPAGNSADELVDLARQLGVQLRRLRFAPPVAHVYNPLEYAWPAHELYLRRYGAGPKRIVFLGMNPGPFGMVQTGVPFGEITSVRQWLKIEAAVNKPRIEHPRRRVSGFDCPRSEVSGRRLWQFFATCFETPERFFSQHMVLNYCPLAFLESTGRNRTPDKLPADERAALFAVCDAHLRKAVGLLEAEWLIGIGDFAAKRATELFAGGPPRIGRILHPSPANPRANRNWATTAASQLKALGVWS